MRRKLIFLFVFLLIPFISGEIIIKDTFDSVYSVGDMIDVNFSIEKQVDISEYLESYLVCDGDRLLVSKRFIDIDDGVKEFFSFSFPSNLEGECVFEIDFDEENVESEEFEIRSKIDITFSISSKSIYPGEKVSINGSAVKSNGKFLDGTVRVFADSIVDRVFEVDDGRFSGNFEIFEDTAAGEKEFVVEALDKDVNEDIINSGRVVFKLEVKQKPSAIEVNSKESVSPPENITLNFKLIDQSGKLIENESLLVKVFDPSRNIVFEKTFQSDGEFDYFFDKNSLRGAWDFNFYFGSVFLSKQVYVGENPEVSAIVLKDSGKSYLRITNEGNVFYEGVVLVVLEGEKKEEEVPINLDLDIGESYDYLLNYDGEYNLTFQGEALGRVSLTGASVGIDVGLGESGYWIFFAILLLVVILYVGYKNSDTISKFISKKKEQRKKGKKTKDMYSRKFKEDTNVRFTGRKAYIAFFKFDKFFEDARVIISNYGWSFRRVGDGVYFILFYSQDKGSEKKLLQFVKELRDVCKKKGIKMSASIHSDGLEGREDFLKNFSSIGKKLLSFSKGEVIVSKNFKESVEGLLGSVRYFEVDGSIIEAYSI